ncbi:hypothetical protein M406DRAFT_59507 [Cryphonectria parasitica EP155]|uniref:Nucleoside transporter n=1 Tax=Cryphonectria parasitica (strain ATCC 38755 / EP155) TaxID=660469 RepID=A0A9P5CU97_CRYP1|nr:uncharacterized protein M406DRAFT_59507 [Cryphonectria parasitica EP155]KAF3770522.1 hypothetical protein M406DRAFT_59507 [Cryphonectria parasitica EP155]
MSRYGHPPTIGDVPFSWFEYTIFALLGVAMLWAWNMFLAASPYFASRFFSHPSIARTFQSSILTVSTITNLTATLLLTHMQRGADYANRIKLGLVINTLAFALLTLSTSLFRDISPEAYLGFLLVDVCFSALATGLFQNGAFAFAASFGRSEYTQAIMAGQGLAGVLPALAQMISVLVVRPPKPATGAALPQDGGDGGRSKEDDALGDAAFIYFLTAVLMSIVTLVSFFPLVRRHQRLAAARVARLDDNDDNDGGGDDGMAGHQQRATRKVVSILTLFRKLHWAAGSVAICFVATIGLFPVFTAKILSVHPPPRSRFLDPEVFIPLSFLAWNTGDLAGRVSTAGPLNARARRRPAVLFLFGLVRFVALPLYLLCNLHGAGAVVNSDVFYLVFVQVPFGLSNGWLASNAMMAAAEGVEESEREAAGGFMGLCLVIGLTAGSLLSFTVTGL